MRSREAPLYGVAQLPRPAVLGKPTQDLETLYTESPPEFSFRPAITSSAYIQHEVTSVDTLVGLALRYDVSVQELVTVNRLSSTDIWFKKCVLIPRSGPLRKIYQPSQEDLRNATRSLRITAVSHAACCDASTARTGLARTDDSFSAAVEECRKMRAALQAGPSSYIPRRSISESSLDDTSEVTAGCRLMEGFKALRSKGHRYEILSEDIRRGLSADSLEDEATAAGNVEMKKYR